MRGRHMANDDFPDPHCCRDEIRLVVVPIGFCRTTTTGFFWTPDNERRECTPSRFSEHSTTALSIPFCELTIFIRAAPSRSPASQVRTPHCPLCPCATHHAWLCAARLSVSTVSLRQRSFWGRGNMCSHQTSNALSITACTSLTDYTHRLHSAIRRHVCHSLGGQRS
jgi:hypothetical protein